MSSRKIWVYVNLFRGCLIDCEHFRSVVLNVWTRKDLMNTQKFTFLSKSVSCPYKARVLKNHIFHVFSLFSGSGTLALYGHDAYQSRNMSCCVFIDSFRVHNFKTTLRKCSQSIRLPRNMFIYTQKCLEPIARMRFFHWTPNEGYIILYSSILGRPSF